MERTTSCGDGSTGAGLASFMNSPYWKWRNETAFGTDSTKRPPLRERIYAILEYGKWVHRMKRRL